MCGIVGLVGTQPVASRLIEALGRLEYRGYDSAGIALSGPGLIAHKLVGRAQGLHDAVRDDGHRMLTGIAHTRWATHGRPEARNAHPHVYAGIAVVHNGIIENHAGLRAELVSEGHVFLSDTDSEVVPHLIARARAEGLMPEAAVRAACARLEGAYAIAVLFEDAPDRLLVARHASPVMVGTGSTAGAVASDPVAMAGTCDQFTELHDGDLAIVTAGSVRLLDATDVPVDRGWQPVCDPDGAADLDSYAHHTRREIAEQPAALRRTLAGLAGRTLPPALASASRLIAIGCGSSLFAAGAARGWIERLVGIPCAVEIASEFRYRDSPIEPGTVGIVVSQSGETADVLAAMALLRVHGVPIVAVVNVPNSTIARSADLVWPTQAGREQGVAATKSFTTQLAALLLLAMAFAEARGRARTERLELAAALAAAPDVCAETEDLEPILATLARHLTAETEALFLGRREGAAIAAEAALKLKELSYLHAEAYPAGELKHGPIALIRPGSPVIVMAEANALLPKMVSNTEEVRARGARVIALTDVDGARAFHGIADTIVALPGRGVTHVFALSVAQQLLAYHAALALQRDVDRPRNLAKSVTVE